MSILTTGSRGPLVAFGVGIAFMYWGYTFFVNRKKEKKNQFILFSVLFIFLLRTVETDGRRVRSSHAKKSLTENINPAYRY